MSVWVRKRNDIVPPKRNPGVHQRRDNNPTLLAHKHSHANTTNSNHIRNPIRLGQRTTKHTTTRRKGNKKMKRIGNLARLYTRRRWIKKQKEKEQK